ncbi:MAG: transporter [Armatimonadetes bacterium]|nr:transporter [Armatimonadota bacterium]
MLFVEGSMLMLLMLSWLHTPVIRESALLAATGFARTGDSLQDPGPIITDRPDFTESPETVPFGRAQLESGYTYSRLADNSEHAVGEVLLRVAVSRRSEIRLAANSYFLSSDSSSDAEGFEDPSLGFKFRLNDGGERARPNEPAIALILSSSLPIGDREVSERKWQPSAVLAFGWDISDRSSAGVNLGYVYASENGMRFSQIIASAAFGVSLTERLGAYVETYGFLPGAPADSNQFYINGGLTLLLDEGQQIDWRIGFGLNGIWPDWFTGLGAPWRW